MAELSTPDAVPGSAKTARWPPAWLPNVGVVIGLGLVVLLSSMAIGTAATSMTEHGVSVGDFQFAGTSAKAKRATTNSVTMVDVPPGGFSRWSFLS